MYNTDNNPRRDFLKKIPFAIFSIGAFSFIRFGKSHNLSDKKFKTLSRSEADEIIKKEPFSASVKIRPLPAPVPKKI
jgi:hypothetical protein